MAALRPRIWNLGRQLAGNLLPLIFALPLLALALQEIVRNGPTSRAFLYTLGFFVIGWLAVNFLGLVGNRSLRRKMDFRYRDEFGADPDPRQFVGFARPGKFGLLDPHEDVGWLVYRNSTLDYWGEQFQFQIPYASVVAVSLRRNFHSLLGLGGWLSVDAEVGGSPVRLLVEPRESAVHIVNSRARKVWRTKIIEKVAQAKSANSTQSSSDLPSKT